MWSSPVRGRPPPLHKHKKMCETARQCVIELGHSLHQWCVCALLTLVSIWDELNRKHDNPAAVDGVWTHMNLWWRVEGGNERKDKGWGEDTEGKREERQGGVRSRERLGYIKTLVEIHSMSSSPFSSPRHKRHSSQYSVSQTKLPKLLSHRHSDAKQMYMQAA